ncbi:hypothetical protein BK133_00725 [Paenibacillus sp. FSL H8-0548]|nr:hypothetical protein BK133_00725 [Paenibacillus sp. FSL H8-0548]
MLCLLRKEQGSFTLESTIVFPLLLGLILLFILFGMYMYQKVIVYYAASTTAERAAYSWDNSSREARNGMLTNLSYDGLYWRISEDKLLGSLFGTSEEEGTAVVALPLMEAKAEENDPLANRKLKQSVEWIGKAGLAYEGQVSYERSAVKKTIEVKLKAPLSNQLVEKSWLRRESKSVAAASVVDPVEFIRSVDLVRYYYAKFSKGAGGGEQSRSRAGQALAPYKGSMQEEKSK